MVHILPAAPLGTTDQMSPNRAADPIVLVPWSGIAVQHRLEVAKKH
jgi:hypothetical protein